MKKSRIAFYSILIICSLAFFWFSWIKQHYPYHKLQLYNTQRLAQVPSECEWVCEKIEYFRDEENSCTLYKVTSLVDPSKEEAKVQSIQKQALNVRRKEKWESVYIFKQDTYYLFEEKCWV